MSNYIYLFLVLVGCLLGAIAILNEQLGSLDKQFEKNFQRIERSLSND